MESQNLQPARGREDGKWAKRSLWEVLPGTAPSIYIRGDRCGGSSEKG